MASALAVAPVSDAVATPRADRDILLVRKLAHHRPLQHADREILAKALSLDVRHVQHRTTLLDAGAVPTKLGVMIDGWAVRTKRLGCGRAQVIAFYLPGDVCDFGLLAVPVNDSTIELLAGARVAGLSREAIGMLNHNQPRITRGLWWEAQTANAIQREWMVNIGLRDARARVAHLLCEIVARLELVGLCSRAGCALPITQGEFASACAMTTAHANRMLSQLRADGIAAWRDGGLDIADWPALVAVAGFDPAYLHLAAPPPQPAPRPVPQPIPPVPE